MMYTCQSCGQQYYDQVNFCSRCGSTNIAYTEGLKPAHLYYGESGYPVTYAEPVKKESTAPAIVGFIFGLLGFFFSLYLFIIGMIALGVSYEYYYYGASEEMFLGFLIVGLFLPFPFGLVGLINSAKAKRLRGMAVVGLILSIISLVLWAVLLFMTMA